MTTSHLSTLDMVFIAGPAIILGLAAIAGMLAELVSDAYGEWCWRRRRAEIIRMTVRNSEIRETL